MSKEVAEPMTMEEAEALCLLIDRYKQQTGVELFTEWLCAIHELIAGWQCDGCQGK